jgi:small-conductance mechanosensitive channel
MGLLAFAAFTGCDTPSVAAQPTPVAPATVPSPDELRTLANLLSKPEIQAWLKERADQSRPPITNVQSASDVIGSYLSGARMSLQRLMAAVSDLHDQLKIIRATLVQEFDRYGPLTLIGLLIAFVLFGTCAEILFWVATTGIRRRIAELPVDTTEARLQAILTPTIYGLGAIAIFAGGSVGAFVAFDWPPLLQEVLLTYLIVVLAVRLTVIGGRIILAPGAERFRVLPMSAEAARYWFIWSCVLVGAFYFAKGTFRLVPDLGANLDTRTLVGSVLSIILLGLTLTAFWRRPAFDGSAPPKRSQEGWTWLITAYLVGVWLTVFTGQTAPFDIGIVLLLIVLANMGLRLVVEHLVQPSQQKTDEPLSRPLAIVAFDRGLRIVLIGGGALFISHILGLDLVALTTTDTPLMRVARALLDVIIIVLLADFVWQTARVWIDHQLSEIVAANELVTDDEVRNRQRLRTLLPVLRHALLITVAAVAGFMGLSALGVAAGPLVAGAGVIGIAIGFGAQTLVKDVISGMLFLFDDAFRIGEYIESGAIKGTVESFSLRSIKLRHHRGALHTVPFGALSTIRNYSRDWVIDKVQIGVTYDTDLVAVRQIIKDIGKTLQDDPEFAPHILETLKMQGVEAFGDFAIQIRLKMTTKPGEQFPIRRRAFTLIKQAFDERGIKFAYPTVVIAGGPSPGSPAMSAAAKMAVDLVQTESTAHVQQG